MASNDAQIGKVSFDDIYDQPDPRAFFRTLWGFDYQIPEHGRETFAFLARALRDHRDHRSFSVLDLCCSYGINAALLNHDVSLADLFARYASAEVEGLTSDELIAADRSFYAERRHDPLSIIGLDAAPNAIDFAVATGLLAAGSSENLEEHDPSEELKNHLADVGLITVTGGIGYITEVTFDRLLGSATVADPPWIAAFTLRWVDMEPIRTVLGRHGYRLEQLRGRTFRQRRFADDRERDHALAHLRRLGIDPDGVETDGYHHAELYVARPQADADAVPVNELLAPIL